jgi:hypothetical protein
MAWPVKWPTTAKTLLLIHEICTTNLHAGLSDAEKRDLLSIENTYDIHNSRGSNPALPNFTNIALISSFETYLNSGLLC